MKVVEGISEKIFNIACGSSASVLITGSTGTGKSRLAKRIHDASTRSQMPFVTVNLASLHEGTLESELFGYERGAFTGAEQRRQGRLEAANGGTVFLDEIAELSPRLQSRLLEFLQSKSISPLGSNRDVKLDIRVISATHQDLERAVSEGRFREDLFHRIRVISLELPSLLDQAADFDRILHTVLADLIDCHGRPLERLTEAAASRLESYTWPGNYRELRNVLEYAVLSSEAGIIDESDLPEWFNRSTKTQPVDQQDLLSDVAEESLDQDYGQALLGFERNYLRYQLARHAGMIGRTARGIGMNKATLIRKIRRCGLAPHPPNQPV